MSKVLDTFYKGNAKRFGLGAWNSVKDDFNEVSKSQNFKKPFTDNINNDPSNIYNPQNTKFQKYNHFSPNLIRIQYFNDQFKEFENKRNIHLNDYLQNARYNVYYDQYDPLFDRRKNVQKRLDNIKNKLLNDEEQKLIRKQKKIEEENRILDELIIENSKKPNEELFRMIESKDNNYENDFDFEKDESKTEILSNDYSDKNSILVLSRTSSDENTSTNNENFDLFMQNEENNPNNISPRKSIFSTKTNKFKKNKSSSVRNSISHNNKKKHTDILKIMMNIEKYTNPINNVNNELVDQNSQSRIIFSEIYNDIKQLKKDFKERMNKYNENTEKNINLFKDILNMCENNNIRNSVDNIFYRNGQNKLKIDKNYLDSEIYMYKNQIEKNIDNDIKNYGKEKNEQDYEKKLKNEPILMENDYNLRVKGNERSKYGLIHLRNLYNQIEKMPNINIKSQELGQESVIEFSPSDTVKSNLFTYSNNSKNNIFPALRGLKEKYTTISNSENEGNEANMDKNKTVKKKKKKKRKEAYVKTLGVVEEEYEGHKDISKERKETIIEFKDENDLKSNKTLVNSQNKDKIKKINNNKIKTEKNEKKSENEFKISQSKIKTDSKIKNSISKNKSKDSDNNSENIIIGE